MFFGPCLYNWKPSAGRVFCAIRALSRESVLLLFLCSLPLWLGAFFCVLTPTALAMLGPVLVRRRYPLSLLVKNNEIAGFKFATIGVIYAVILAFAIVAVWEKFSDAELRVLQETGASTGRRWRAAPKAATRRGRSMRSMRPPCVLSTEGGPPLASRS